MERDFGGEFADKGFKENSKAISTGHDDLDAVLTKSQGGISLGDICEISGSEGSGKTSVAMRTVGMAQKLGLRCAWIDAEGSFSNGLAQVNRCDPNELLFLKIIKGQGESARLLSAAEILNKIFKAIWSGVFSLIVIDSVAALIPERVTSEKFDPTSKGISELARDLSSQLPKISAACSEKECTVIFINQLRMKPGQMYGDPETTPGGRALKFYASQRISVKRVSGKNGSVIQIDEDGIEDIVGHYARIKVVKNRRHEPCFDALEIPIYYREYFPDMAKRCYDIARKLNVISKRKAMLTWKHNGKVVAGVEGESSMLSFIRNDVYPDLPGYETYLAHCCLEAEKGEKNKNKKNPVKLPKSIETEALKFDPKKHSINVACNKSKKSKKLGDMDICLENEV